MTPILCWVAALGEPKQEGWEGRERYFAQLNASVPTRGAAKEMGTAPYRAHVLMGNLSTGLRFLPHNQLISLFLNPACMYILAYTPAATATTLLHIWNLQRTEVIYLLYP